MRKVIGIGETILDIIFKNNQPHTAVPGGSTFNGLISLGRLGVPVSFISEVGNDRVGDIIRDFMMENNLSTRYVDRFPDGKSPISLAFLDDDSNANYTFYKEYPKQRLDVPLPEINEDDIFIYGSYYSLNPALRGRMVEFLNYAASARRFFTTIRISARRTPTKPYASLRHYSKISNMPISYVVRTKTSSIFSERLTVKRSTLTISVSTATVSSLPTEPEA